MTKSLWAQYREELDGGQVIEVAGGFIAFRTLPEWDYILISDVYVSPELRESGLAKRLTESVNKIAVELGKLYLVGYADVASNTCKLSLLAQLSVGFVPFQAEQGRILLRKPVKQEHQ